MDSGRELMAGLSRPEAYPHPVSDITVRETHISWVFLTGEFAYKVKKPVKLDFLDFSTLAARRRYCDEELRLNRRTAPDLYLNVLPVCGSPAEPVIGGAGEPFEYALRMRQFPQDAELGHLLAAGALRSEALKAFGARMAQFHEAADRKQSRHFGRPKRLRARIEVNLDQIRPMLEDEEARRLEPVAGWLRSTAGALTGLLRQRADAGLVRECHGDLHLGNLVALQDGITAFDCIEFDPALRWIDVLDDVSFLVMDLLVHHRADLAFAFLDGYLADSGDYEGLRVLDLYAVNRSVVRAKVAAVSRREATSAAEDEHGSTIRRHLHFAAQWPCRASPALVLMHGLPASGKSSVAQALIETLPAIRVSSDIERKRLAGIARHAGSGSGLGSGLYDREHTEATYGRLAESAAAVLLAGHNVIVDASFLNAARREQFCALGRRLRRPVVLVDCRAPLRLLEQRIDARAVKPHDSEADRRVLDYAIEHQDRLRPDEDICVLPVDTAAPLDPVALADRLRSFTTPDRSGTDDGPGTRSAS